MSDFRTYSNLRGSWLYTAPKYLSAWTDLLMHAVLEDMTVSTRKGDVELKAGTVRVSKRELESRWHMSHQSVDAFLSRLEEDGFVHVETTPRTGTVIHILNRSLFVQEDGNRRDDRSFDRSIDRSFGTDDFPKIKGKDIEFSVGRDRSLDRSFDRSFDRESENGNTINTNNINKNIDNDINSVYGEQPKLPEKAKRKVFVKPTLEEVRAYCEERKNGIDPERFFYYYEATDWKIGKSRKPMASWKAAVHTWERNNKAGFDKITGADMKATAIVKSARSFRNFDERDTDYDALIKRLQGD